jgi:GTPase
MIRGPSLPSPGASSSRMAEHRSGLVAVIGHPNVGKSTLINAMLGQKVAAVSPRPQTTRRRQLGILTRPDAQILFLDTPGIHSPRHKLGQFLNQEAEAALEGVDVILLLVDASTEPTEEDARIISLVKGLRKAPVLVLAANKIDLISPDSLAPRLEAYQSLIGHKSSLVAVSALNGENLPSLLALLISLLPARPPEYEEDQITDLYEREIAADLIREAALFKLRDEVPHSLAVRVDEFKERENGMVYMAATLFVERDSQKGIVIGQGGRMLKEIGTRARKEIEEMGGHKVFLELRVKVEKEWRNNESALKRLGYKLKHK